VLDAPWRPLDGGESHNAVGSLEPRARGLSLARLPAAEAPDGRPRPPILLEPRRRRVSARRVIDVLVVVLAAPVVAPLVLLLALAVKLDSRGPAFWIDDRSGVAGRRFRLIKLRTMTVGAHELKEDLWAQSVLPWPDFKVPNDPRITRVGGVLRRTSLDELPQFWNLLRGDLTLVGPRPNSIHPDDYELWQTERLEVTPGLFGRWQAEGRARVNFADRCRMDIRQVRSQGLVADVGLALKSLVAVFRQRGAS
jgi:lipopolysaccharide/colanic/teichoic acid biosynthesis glycosyltransferase